MIHLEGIYPPIATPFDADERVAFGKLESNIARWLQQPLDGLVVPGSNSEAVFLTRDERSDILRACAEQLRGTGKRLIAGTGAESTAETIRLTNQAAELGADAALVIPPSFYKPQLTPDVLIAHYRAVADASPIPILLYNVPVFTGIDFAPATVVALAGHPNIVGMKDSSSNVLKVGTILSERPAFRVFAGTGGALLPFLSIGAVGGIAALANFAAKPLRHLLDAFRDGRPGDARSIQLSLMNINAAVTSRFGVPGLKYAMDRAGFYGGPVRRPLLPIGQDARAEIDRLLGQISLD